MSLHLPRVGVHGNHDPPGLLQDLEIEDLHLRRTSVAGMTIAGFEGCVAYGAGGPHQYTQKQAAKLAKRLPAADVLLCHCPPFGINDDPADPAHVGYRSEEHTSELQSRQYLVCRLLLEKKKTLSPQGVLHSLRAAASTSASLTATRPSSQVIQSSAPRLRRAGRRQGRALPPTPKRLRAE